MVGEAKDTNYRVIRAKYFQLYSAVIEHERNVAMGRDSDPETVVDLAQKVASAICDAIKGVECLRTKLLTGFLRQRAQ
ncbi:MAG: hypothetical protein QXR48_04730 [Candidatus Woesearchaeota archaeon]